MIPMSTTPKTDSKSAVTSLVEDCGGVQTAGSQSSGAYIMVDGTKRRVIQLKTWPAYFHDVRSGAKPFEIRSNDRDFRVSDVLHLREWHPDMGYSGEETLKEITYTLQDAPEFGLMEGYAILGLAEVVADGPGLGIDDISEIDPTPSQLKDVPKDSPVSPGEGYRWQQVGERITRQSEFRSHMNGQWTISGYVGKDVQVEGVYRIPTSTPAKETVSPGPLTTLGLATKVALENPVNSDAFKLAQMVKAESLRAVASAISAPHQLSETVSERVVVEGEYGGHLPANHGKIALKVYVDAKYADRFTTEDPIFITFDDPRIPSTDIEERK